MSSLPASRQPETFSGLRALAGCGGCAAKLDPESVAALAGQAARISPTQAELLAGLDPCDDAAVYRLDEHRALVSTVDFFPPLVDDPDDYGAVAAANAVSDVYAMGGEVVFALALSGFPDEVPRDIIAQVSSAAAAVVADCGGSIAGGHSIRCAEPVFGLAVSGFVHPQRIWRKSGAQPGDVLVLSKPIGSGILLTDGSPPAVARAVDVMRTTNHAAAQALKGLDDSPHAVTDITGNGLIGHAQEMAIQSGVSLHIDASRVPLIHGALSRARNGIRTSADKRNRQACRADTTITRDWADPRTALLFDPQTSGGLLAAVAPVAVSRLVAQGFAEIGRVEAGPARVVVN